MEFVHIDGYDDKESIKCAILAKYMLAKAIRETKDYMDYLLEVNK